MVEHNKKLKVAVNVQLQTEEVEIEKLTIQALIRIQFILIKLGNVHVWRYLSNNSNEFLKDERIQKNKTDEISKSSFVILLFLGL